jgi:hypothetical protein
VPTIKPRGEDKLFELFLSVYEDRGWAGELSRVDYPERVKDGAVELIATQLATGRTLAIEHTIIEPFIGEKKDFYENFQELARQLRADDSLMEPGVALYIDAPVEVLPKGVPWQPIIEDVKAFLRAEASSFGTQKEIRNCPSACHPKKTIPLQVRRQPLERTTQGFVIVQRYGEMRVIESVRTALERKLPKPAATEVDCRILMLERDQGFVSPQDILKDVEMLRPVFPLLSKVHELWICDTATFGAPREWVEFVRHQDGLHAESFSFYQGELESIGRNGMPMPLT